MKPTKQPNGTFRIQIELGNDELTGKRKRKTFTAKTKKECIARYEEWKSKQSFNSKDTLTLGQYFKTWLFDFRKAELKPSTFERYYGVYENYIMNNSKFASTKLTDITTLQIQKYYNSLMETKEVSTVKNTHRYIKTFFADCVNQGLIVRNPCNNIKFPKSFSVEEESNQFIYLSTDEQKSLVKALKGDKSELIILLALTCGMRLGEILALSYKDFDFDNNLINVNKSIKRISSIDENGNRIYRLEVMQPKTKNSIRKVPLPTFLIPIIKDHNKENLQNKLKLGELYYNKDFLFCKINGEPIDTKQPNRRLKSILKKLQLNTDIRFHDLRGIFISNCIENGIEPKTVASVVGHSDISTTLNIYAKLSKNKIVDDMTKVNSIFSNIL